MRRRRAFLVNCALAARGAALLAGAALAVAGAIIRRCWIIPWRVPT